jgi:hypothetical protein
MAANLNEGLRPGLRKSIMRSLAALLPYVVIGYWHTGYTRND